jgi:hypothetical protein
MTTTKVSQVGQYEPHPYALMLPVLTDAEYRALKADIKANGILYPVILDEDDRILDGVHRCRIARELKIEPPVIRHEGLTDERKLHLAVGLNMRRRHLDADRRRELVRKLHINEQLSIRTIAQITGWTKSTVQRDLKASPFESALERTRDLDAISKDIAGVFTEISHEKLRDWGLNLSQGFSAYGEAARAFYRWADRQWKQGEGTDTERVTYLIMDHMLRRHMTLFDTIRQFLAVLRDEEIPEPEILCHCNPSARLHEWLKFTADERTLIVEHMRRSKLVKLLNAVPFGTQHDEGQWANAKLVSRDSHCDDCSGCAAEEPEEGHSCEPASGTHSYIPRRSVLKRLLREADDDINEVTHWVE